MNRIPDLGDLIAHLSNPATACQPAPQGAVMTSTTTADTITTAGYDPNTIHIGAIWECPQSREWLPDGHRRLIKLTAIGPTVTGWQVRVLSWIGAGRPDWTAATPGAIHVDHLVRDYQHVTGEQP